MCTLGCTLECTVDECRVAPHSATSTPHPPWQYFPTTWRPSPPATDAEEDATRAPLWCTCGLSTTQPWCDGQGHKGTTFRPLAWRVEGGQQTLYSICNCKYTKSAPFCDGSRKVMVHLS